MDATKDKPTNHTDPLLRDFPGHVPNRSRTDADFRLVNVAEFLSRLEPRTVQRTGPGQWASTRRYRPGEPTKHGLRMRLLDLAREREHEQRAGIKRTP